MTAEDVVERRADEVDWTVAVQQVLNATDGNRVLMVPVRDRSGRIADFRIDAAAPGTVDAFGRTAEQLIGLQVRQEYGDAVRGTVWDAYRAVCEDGQPRTVGPFPFPRTDPDLPPAQFTASLRRVGPGVLNTWTREDDLGRPEERIALTERLANLGWAEHNLSTGSRAWSDQLYQIFERDPADGPLPDRQIEAAVLPDDRTLYHRARQRVARGRPVDITIRIQLPSGIKHIRTVTEPVSDVYGRPLRVVGVVQDVTARVTSGTRLALVERQLHEHRQSLAAENQLVATLQQIILPIPVVPVDLAGLRVAVRYLPAEHLNRIGGDWYHAANAPDGSVVLAVGDVAGHGIQAAATMAQLRGAFTTLVATTTTEPAQLLGHLNRLLYGGEDPTSIATAVVARYQPDRGVLQWAQAGHPPPLRTNAGTTTELARPAGVMLGALPDPDYQTTTLTIQPGDLLLFYTDGLIERRGATLEDGLRSVVDTLNRISLETLPPAAGPGGTWPRDTGPGDGTPQPLAELLARLDRANPLDDTCIVAVRPLAAGAGADQAAARPRAGAPQPAS